MKVKAKQDVFYGKRLRRAGEVFEFEGKEPGKHMEAVEQKKGPGRPPASKPELEKQD